MSVLFPTVNLPNYLKFPKYWDDIIAELKSEYNCNANKFFTLHILQEMRILYFDQFQ